MLDRCDDDGIPAYLESSSIRNQALYYRHGFEVIEELNWPGDRPPFSLMWRKPRQGYGQVALIATSADHSAGLAVRFHFALIAVQSRAYSHQVPGSGGFHPSGPPSPWL